MTTRKWTTVAGAGALVLALAGTVKAQDSMLQALRLIDIAGKLTHEPGYGTNPVLIKRATAYELAACELADESPALLGNMKLERACSEIKTNYEALDLASRLDILAQQTRIEQAAR